MDMLLIVAFRGVADIITGKWTNALRACHLITTVLLQDFFQSGTKTYQELRDYKEAVREHLFERLWVYCLIKAQSSSLAVTACTWRLLLPTPDVIDHQYFQSGLLSLAVRVGDGGTAGQGVHAGQLATLASQLVHCCAYGKRRVVPLLNMDVLPDILPPCPVYEQDEHDSVVTNYPNRFCTARCGLQHN